MAKTSEKSLCPCKPDLCDGIFLQGFHFSKVPNLGYGLIQNEGGPCGPLAVVQAKMLRYLMFPDGDETVSPSWSMVNIR